MSLGWLGLIITFLWIVGLTNAYNFMDGIDGIAGGQAVVAGMGWAVLGWLTVQPLVGLMGVLLAAASLGFLGHNWPPARIFMGDVAALSWVSCLPCWLWLQHATRSTRLALVGILFVWPFVFDATFTFLRRLRMARTSLLRIAPICTSGWSSSATAIDLSLCCTSAWRLGVRFWDCSGLRALLAAGPLLL